MEIKELTERICDYSGIFIDSRKVIRDSVFIAIKGAATDGHLYIKQAIEKGAVVIVHEDDIDCKEQFPHVAVVKVSDTEYKVVNKEGKIIKGNRKLIKDDYENLLVILNGRLVAYITDAQDKMKLKWCKKPIARISDLSGYYYYNGESEIRDYVALAVAVGTQCPTPAQLANIPVEMRVNFR